MRHHLLIGLLALLCVAMTAACDRDQPRAAAPSPSPPATPTATASPTAPAATATNPPAATPTPVASPVAALPRFEPAPCPFKLAAGQEEGRTVTCGAVVVPQDYDRPGGPVIRLAVARFTPSRARPGQAPVFWLDGGPGGESLSGIGRQLSPLAVTAFAGDRELVVFDQRGVGASRPSLACPELVELKYATAPKRLSRSEDAANSLRAAFACRDRLRAEGVDLAAYTSAAGAADINAIRTVLGYEQVNLLGVSYGTRLALTVMRDFPAIVRAVVLDSPFPVQANLYPEIYSSADRAFTLLFQSCRSATVCNGAYPDLEARFSALVQRLNRDPLPVTFTSSGRTVDYLLTGDRLVGAMFQMLYQSSLIPRLPGILTALEAGNVNLFRRAYTDLFFFDGISQGMYYSVQCAEEARFTSAAQVQAAARAVRPELGGGTGDGFSDDSFFPLCEAWGGKVVPARENEPVRSDLPVLILSGEFDPITPPSYAELAARSLSHAFVFVFPGLGHGPGLSDVCPMVMLQSFWGAPERAPDSGCIARMAGPRWDVP